MGTPHLVADKQPDSHHNLPRCGTPTYVSRTRRLFSQVFAGGTCPARAMSATLSPETPVTIRRYRMSRAGSKAASVS